MRSRLRLLLAAVSFSVAFAVSGCTAFKAELENRGGFTDRLLDEYWFRADTKELRVLRSYMLIGTLLRMSARNFTSHERYSVALKANVAIAQAADAAACAYRKNEQACNFFDDRMAELDRSLLRLAIAVLTSSENENLFEQVKDKLVAKTVVGQSVATFAKVIDAGTETINVFAKATSVASSLLKAGFVALDTGQRLGALYRDAVEIDMIVVLRSLEENCEVSCSALAREVYLDGRRLYLAGSGNFSAWRNFLATTYQAGQFSRYAIPSEEEFIQVSDLIWRACDDLAESEDTRTVCRSYPAKEKKQSNEKKQCDFTSQLSSNCLIFGEEVSRRRQEGLTIMNEIAKDKQRRQKYWKYALTTKQLQTP